MFSNSYNVLMMIEASTCIQHIPMCELCLQIDMCTHDYWLIFFFNLAENSDSSDKMINSEEDKDKVIFRNNKIKPEDTTEETDANILKQNTHECDSLIEKSVEIKFPNEEIKSRKDETREDECGEINISDNYLFLSIIKINNKKLLAFALQ